MKYVCKICGYVYDDDQQSVPFQDLPDSWVCPLCGAAKSDFEPQASSGAVKPAAERTAAIRRGENDHGGENDDHDGMHEDMHRLSAGELSALFSNLARGCEKQYLQAQADLFTKLADSFAASPRQSQTPIRPPFSSCSNKIWSRAMRR